MKHDSPISDHLLTNDYKPTSESLDAAAQRPSFGNNLRAVLRGEVVDEVVSEVVKQTMRW